MPHSILNVPENGMIEGFNAALSARGIVADPDQLMAAMRLQQFYDELIAFKAARRTRLAMSLGGFDDLARDGQAAYDWLQAPPNCVAGGSNEVQLNVLSKRALELPEYK